MRRVAVLALLAAIVAGCTGSPILANPPAAHPIAPAQTPRPVVIVDPVPVHLPADDAPHDRLTEWWYYTGHLRDDAGAWYGFEYVIFRAERGAFPVAWASHLAITDVAGQRFVYTQRSEVGPQVSTPRPDGFRLSLTGADPRRPETFDAPAWTMAGSGGVDHLAASTTPDEASTAGSTGALGLALDLEATKPAAFHDTDGWIDFGPAGGSYYYSRTRVDATGTLTLDGRARPVDGIAWFDHQWGDFIAVGGGGWDWFAVDLDDGSELTISLVRSLDGSHPLVYGTAIDASGGTSHLPSGAFTVESVGQWASPRSGAVYPSGWRISVPADDLELELTPVILDQELDTRATTGVIYWEGEQTVTGSRAGRPLAGRGYVELTGYTPAATAVASPLMP